MSQIFVFSCAENQANWLKAAIEESGLKPAEFLRQSCFRAASAVTGDDAPERERQADLVTQAAAKHGLDRAQFIRFATLVAAGLDTDTAMARASVKRRPRKVKAEADAK